MKILLDQSTPRNLARFMPEHEVWHAAQLGWEELANGKLLKMAGDHGYDLLITADQNLSYQQNAAAHEQIGVLALSTNNWNLMRPFIAAIIQAVGEVRPGEMKNLFCGRFVAAKFRSDPAL